MKMDILKLMTIIFFGRFFAFISSLKSISAYAWIVNIAMCGKKHEPCRIFMVYIYVCVWTNKKKYNKIWIIYININGIEYGTR